jgi:hypothetical protein
MRIVNHIGQLTFLLTLLLLASATGQRKTPFWKSFTRKNNNQQDMGQAVRLMKYDRATNEANAIPVLQWAGNPMKWHRLDDGVMGGRSETVHEVKDGLHFTGTINTDGGGFTSVRAPIHGIPKEAKAIRLFFRGDGKTYKLLFADGNPNTGSPFARRPTWQADLPTEDRTDSQEWQESTILLSTLLPAFGGRAQDRPSAEEDHGFEFEPTEMRQVGLMLSLRLSDGSPNPKETFGQGTFPFSLRVKSIEPIVAN